MAETKVTQTEITPISWVTPTLNSGWVAFDTGAIPIAGSADTWRYPRYFKDALGIVHLTGLVKDSTGAVSNSTTHSIIFNLPAGLRPGHTLLVSTYANDNAFRLDIRTDGNIAVAGTDSLTGTGWISLNNIHFYAEQ